MIVTENSCKTFILMYLLGFFTNKPTHDATSLMRLIKKTGLKFRLSFFFHTGGSCLALLAMNLFPTARNTKLITHAIPPITYIFSGSLIINFAVTSPKIRDIDKHQNKM